MNVLIIGSGGREHAICWKVSQNPEVEKIYCAPGNAGIGKIAQNVPIKAEDVPALAEFAKNNKIDLTIVGPEVSLAAGISDFFQSQNLAIFGPIRHAATLESSKTFAKNLMLKYNIPTASYRSFEDYKQAQSYLAALDKNKPLVIKADGLAAGKGVFITKNTIEAETALKQIMQDKILGSSGNTVVIEEFLEGEEASVQIFLDGEHYSVMPAAQDHKRVFDNDDGPNTGGMGAYAPAPIITAELSGKINETILSPLIAAFKKEGILYRGVLYVGLMIKEGRPYILEFNCRFGDPETQVVLPLLKTDLIEIINAINAGELNKINIEWHNKYAVCVVLASGGYPGDYKPGKEISGLEEASKLSDTIIFHAGTSINDKTHITTSGGRVLGITSLGNDIKQAVNNSYQAVNKISFDKMHYRKDIAKKAFKN